MKQLPLCAAALFLWSAAAQAQPDDARTRARALVQEGARKYEDGDYQAALEKFEAARKVFPSPKILYNVALALRGLARDAEAVEAYERFLAEARDASPANRQEAREALATLNARLGQIQIECNADGAGISLDGRDVGLTPRTAPLRASVGMHQVVVSRPGWPAHVERVRVNAGAVVTVRADLSPPPSAAAPAPPPPIATPVATVAATAPDEDDLSHAGRFGVSLRLDLALKPETGQRILPGITYGLTPAVELDGGAIIGKQAKGLWVGGRTFLLQGRWKPEVGFGVPIFFVGDEIAAGLQLSGGLDVDLSAHAGLFASIGAAAFPRASVSADRLWLLASAGAEARF